MAIRHTGKAIPGPLYYDPDGNEFFSFEWEDELATGETIDTNSFAIYSDATKATDASGDVTLSGTTKSGTVTSVKVTGGTVGTTYYLENTIVTSGAETHVRAVSLECKDL